MKEYCFRDMKMVCISCFDNYDLRIKEVIDFFESKGAQIKYLYADYNHGSKTYDNRVRKNGVAIHVASYKNNISFRRLFSHYLFAKRVSEYLGDYQPNLIYSMFPPNLVVKEVADYKKKNKDVKIVFDMYDTWPESIPLNKYKLITKIPFKIWACIRDKGLNKADLILTVSRESGRTVRKLINGKNIPVEVIYPVIRNIERPEYKFRNRDYLSLCYLGNVNYITDLELMLSLLKEIRRYIGVRIHFIGEGLNYSELAETLISIGVEVESHGAVFDMTEKNNIFSLCDMGINLPKKEIHSSMALKSVEYLRAGLPFINSGIGDNWKMAEKRKIGINVSRELVKEKASIIAKLTHEELEDMHRNCIATYDKYYMGQDFEKIFQSVLS